MNLLRYLLSLAVLLLAVPAAAGRAPGAMGSFPG
jgi:hypothetical protein